MNIILLPGRLANGRHISLNGRQAVLALIVGLAVLPALMGVLAYRIQALIDPPGQPRPPAYLQEQERLLTAERQRLAQARRSAETHLNALAQRLGHLQAQLLRLNALGSRLAQLSGLDKREFNFAETPAVGGPARAALSPRVPDFLQALDNLGREIDHKNERLGLLERVLAERQLQAAVTPLGWPVQGGWMSSGFGLRVDPFTGQTMFHEGVDIANRLGSPIHAMGAGIVSYAGHRDGYGLVVEINHGRGEGTRYAHARNVLVKSGDKVDKGQVIALVGTSGRSTGPHLHFEILRNDRPVDPQSYLRQATK